MKEVEGEVGWWPLVNYMLPDRAIAGYDVDYVMIQDFYITGPIRTLLYVYKLTGEKKYLEGAIRGGNFLLLAQNPTGSWSHHFDWQRRAGYGTGSPGGPGGNEVRHGGELNDQGTLDPMWVMIALWHWTQDRRFLDAFRRAADWHIEAQLDGPTFGWAEQYDRNNVPCWARAHEPPAVSWGEAANHATTALFLAHHLTRDEKYLKPIDTFLAWLDKIRMPKGWYDRDDYRTGRPIAAVHGKIYWMDDPQQVKEFLAEGGAKFYVIPGGNRAMRPRNYGWLKSRLRDARNGSFSPQVRKLTDRKQVVPLLKQWLAHRKLPATMAHTDERGLCLQDRAAGPTFQPSNHGATKYTLWVCLLARAALGEIGLEQVYPRWGGLRDHAHMAAKPCEFFNTPLRKRK